MVTLPNSPVILQELFDDHFDKGVTTPTIIGFKFDPVSNVTVTELADGLSFSAFDFFSSNTTAANVVKLPDGANDLTESIRRDGNVGFGVDPTSAIHCKSAGFKFVKWATASNYVTTVEDHTIRFESGITADVGLTLHSAATTPGQILIVVNSSKSVQTITGVVNNYFGLANLKLLPIGTSHTIQSLGGVWVVIDSSATTVVATHNYASTSAPAVAQGVLTVTLGELAFRYSLNAVNGDLNIRSVGSAAVTCFYSVYEQYGTGSVGFVGTANLSAPIGGTWLNLPGNGLGINECQFYVVVTNANVYHVYISNLNSTSIAMSVEKAI